MLFALGYVTGVSTCAFIAAALAYLRHPVERTLRNVETRLEQAGPRPRGYVYMPPSEADEARQRILRANSEKGRDTPISELM